MNEEKELNTIIESVSDGVYVTDGGGKTLRINKAFEEITDIKALKLVNTLINEEPAKHLREPEAVKVGNVIEMKRIISEHGISEKYHADIISKYKR